jgi:hypothetical protein
MNSDDLKASVAAYWRYDRQCPMVSTESNWQLESYTGDFRADVLVVDKDRLLIETEVKCTLGDLRQDKEKSCYFRKHEWFESNHPRLITHQFFFAVPYELANKAKDIVKDDYPYAGLIAVVAPGNCQVYKLARSLCCKPLSLEKLYRLSMCQSSTLCRLARDYADTRSALDRVKKELKQAHKLLNLQEGVKV